MHQGWQWFINSTKAQYLDDFRQLEKCMTCMTFQSKKVTSFFIKFLTTLCQHSLFRLVYSTGNSPLYLTMPADTHNQHRHIGSGRIIIDGIDISTIGIHGLRSRLVCPLSLSMDCHAKRWPSPKLIEMVREA